MSYRETLAKQAGDVLAPGEFYVAAAKYLPRGASEKRAAGGVFGAIGSVVAGSIGSTQVVGGRSLPHNLAMALTNQRLLVFELNQGFERVIGNTHSIPLPDVLDVKCEVGRKLGFRVTYVEIALADGSQISVEAVSPHSKDGESFAQALDGSRRASASSPGSGPPAGWGG
ncbi:MAG TPA: hypothetical protein VL984_09220 [Acidimicrobiales bacterium]|nr:hypothetical protein [Acidimicrobiales bacterium]